VYWASEDQINVAALTHEGKQVWKKPLGAFKSQHGPGVSPMLHKDMVIIANDQDGESFLVALDTKTGEQKWKTPRKSGNAAYSVPCIMEVAGKPQLILTCTATGVSAVDADTGTPLWSVEDLFKQRVVSSPVLAGDLILSQCGQGGGGTRFVAVRPGSSDGKPAKLEYDVSKGIPYVTTPVVYNERVYMVTDGGVAVCLKAADGAVVWQERITVNGRNAAFFGSPVCVNGVVYAITRSGEVVVFKTGDKFELLSINPLGEASHATPAVSGGKMYLRTTNHLISIGGK
jgi:outer membrane protein assembly factor BamB